MEAASGLEPENRGFAEHPGGATNSGQRGSTKAKQRVTRLRTKFETSFGRIRNGWCSQSLAKVTSAGVSFRGAVQRCTGPTIRDLRRLRALGGVLGRCAVGSSLRDQPAV